MDGIIGSTGFVGGHLINKHNFSALFNTRNIQYSSGKSFSTIVCAAAPGSMFQANKFPERDKENIYKLIEQLSDLKVERFVLISSIATLADFSQGDDETTNNFQDKLSYGRHRRELEVFCQKNFETCLILRLPALFGANLKKNFIFDLLNPVPTMLSNLAYSELSEILDPNFIQILTKIYIWDYTVKMFKVNRDLMRGISEITGFISALVDCGYSSIQLTNRNSTFQFYNVENLWSDIQKAFDNNINLLHLAAEPLRASFVCQQLTGLKMPFSNAKDHHENMHSQHGALWGKEGPYLYSATEVLSQLNSFFLQEKINS